MLKHLLLAGLVAMTGGQAEASCTLLKVADLHVTVENNQILIPGELEGHPVKFLFDTSYPGSIIAMNAARRLGVPVSEFGPAVYLGRMGAIYSREEGGFAHISEFSLDGHKVRATTFGVFGPKDNFGTPDIVASLGSDFWSGYDVEIDLPHNVITLFHPKDCAAHNLAYWGNDYNVADLAHYGLRTEVMIKLNGHDVTAIIDSGSRYSTLTERTAARLGVKRGDSPILGEDRPQNVQPTDLLSLIRFSRGIGLRATMSSPDVRLSGPPDISSESGPSTYWLTSFNKLQIDEENISPMGFRVVPTPQGLEAETGSHIKNRLVDYDILLGVDFLKAHRLLLSNSQGKLYFTYVGGIDFAKPF